VEQRTGDLGLTGAHRGHGIPDEIKALMRRLDIYLRV
jgi:hypothetical protein